MPLCRSGLALIVLAGALTWAAHSFDLPVQIAKIVCGDTYMLEPDASLSAQGILSDQACGFNADLYTVAGLGGLLAAGILLLIIGLLVRRRATPRYFR